MATQFTLGPLTVSGANAATQFSTTRLPSHHFLVQCVSTNTDVIWIGDSTVAVGGPGFRLEIPVSGVVLPFVGVPSVEGAPNQFNFQDWYFLSPTAGQKINVVYIQG